MKNLNTQSSLCRFPALFAAGKLSQSPGFFPLILLFCLMLAGGAGAQPTISDFGANPPTPGPDDQSQLTTGSGSPDGLNYYFDNGTPPGQTFTTGPSSAGYTLNTLTIGTAGNSGQLPVAGQAYVLRIYQIANATNSSLVVSYTSQGGFTFADSDWLQWTNLGAPLLPNTQYAYSFGRISSGSGWENMANISGNLYAGGEVCLIPTGGGPVTFGSSHGFDAAFDVGLNVVTALLAGNPTIAPGNPVTNGTAVTINSTVVGPGPLTFQWRTDGGSGGTLTNIPLANASTLSFSTTALAAGFYQYAYVVSNSTTSVTSAPVVLIVNPVVVPTAASLTDQGINIISGANDISQLTGNSGGSYDGLNYYDDNGANHGNWMGQTFTTGTNSQGYYLNSVAVQPAAAAAAAPPPFSPITCTCFRWMATMPL